MGHEVSLNPNGTIILPGAVFSPSGGQIIYVHHNLPSLAGLPSGMLDQYRTSINAALNICRSGRGDIIQLLPGHADSAAAADAWSNLGSKTGITILGPTYGPPATITWSAAASTVLLDTNDIVIDGGPNRNITLNMEPGSGTITVAAPFTVTGARCAIKRCLGRVSTDANNLVTDAIHVNAATDFTLEGCRFYGNTGEITTILKTTGAAHRLRIVNNSLAAPVATAATGVLIDISNAALNDVEINFNHLHNKKAASKFVLKPHASSSGEVSYNRVSVDDTATGAAGLGASTFTTLLRFFQNRIVDDDGLADMLMGTAST